MPSPWNATAFRYAANAGLPGGTAALPCTRNGRGNAARGRQSYCNDTSAAIGRAAAVLRRADHHTSAARKLLVNTLRHFAGARPPRAVVAFLSWSSVQKEGSAVPPCRPFGWSRFPPGYVVDDSLASRSRLQRSQSALVGLVSSRSISAAREY